MASATSSRRRTKAEHRRLPPARTLAAPLRALALGRRVAPLLYFEFATADGRHPSAAAAVALGQQRIDRVAQALTAAVGSLLRRDDRVVAGPGGRWFAALLLDRARAAGARSALSDADLGEVADRLRASIHAHVTAPPDGELAGRTAETAVRAGWTVIEPRDADRPLAELRHALRGAAVVARIEERRGTVLAALTHELRTPLTSILGFAERLRSENVTPRTRARGLRIIEEEARRLRRLVDGLIDAGAWNAGRLDLRRAPRALRPIVERAAGLVHASAAERGVRVTIRGRAQSYVDEDRLLQIVVNLVDNAVRHARRRGSVLVSLGSRSGRAVITVEDDGPGFDPALGSRLGTPFGIGAGGRVGLGLAIAAMLCTAHDGTLAFGHSRLGGARVVVTLPIARRTKRTAPARPASYMVAPM